VNVSKEELEAAEKRRDEAQEELSEALKAGTKHISKVRKKLIGAKRGKTTAPPKPEDNAA
jgi:hypothetical protein